MKHAENVERNLVEFWGIKLAGGGAIEMELSKRLRDKAKTITGKEQFFWMAFARAFEVR